MKDRKKERKKTSNKERKKGERCLFFVFYVLDALRHVGPAACASAHARRAGGRSYGSARAACDDEDYFRTNSGFCGFGRDARFPTGTT